ncbi:MAG TPA: FAD-dependent oxidoreductase [Mycobacteriales bacterium]|jgi:NADH dehydrogenase|nr:FAD-dependent oxidoreductase [Mycobacteriales bacterium]
MTRVVVVGGGFAGFNAAKVLCKRLAGEAEVVLVNPTDYFLYVPLLPEVAAGILDPRRVAVSLPGALPGVRLAVGTVHTVDLAGRSVTYRDTDGDDQTLTYDQLLLTSGSVNKLLPVPGVGEHAHGFRNLAEAVYLRDHLVRQVELADQAEDTDERSARLTFVVVGAGYTGTEVAAQGVLATRALLAKHPRLAGARARWLLLDTADRVLPGLSERLSAVAARTLGERGVEVRMRTSVKEATGDGVTLSDGSSVPTRSLIWCVGVRPDHLVETLGLPTEKGRLVVDADLSVPGQPGLWACGDAAAVPDLTRPGEVTAMTAQHAQRQGARAGKNIAATLGHGRRQQYRHRNLGFVIDLGGFDGAADPLGVPLGGFPAKVVTRGYHLSVMPGNRIRTAVDWAEHFALGAQTQRLDLVRGDDVPLQDQPPA